MTAKLLERAINGEQLNLKEGVHLYQNTATPELIYTANELRMKLHPENYVGWIVDMNINITNVCISGCKFCNFHCKPNEEKAYITSTAEYKTKIDTLLALGGDQVLLQGGLHPKLKLEFYIQLFRELKTLFPNIKLHALGPPEIYHLSKLGRISYRETLEKLMAAGLESLPGAGAEILSDRVRKYISPGKCNTQAWLDVMREAHQLNLVTSATMMFGHIETPEEIIQHLILLREIQSQKPEAAPGFVTFVPWPFMDKGTRLQTDDAINNYARGEDYLRLIAISRIMLSNIKNIQASWLTVGKKIGQLALHAGANDFGSIMIEENVVSSAGAQNQFDEHGIQQAIRDAGFIPRCRNQAYEPFLENDSL